MALERKPRRASARVKKNDGMDQNDPVAGSTTTILEGVKSVGVSRKGKDKRIKGPSLAIKFAAVISLVAALLCLVSQIVVYFQTEAALLWEVDRKGVALSISITDLAEQYLNEYLSIQNSKNTSQQKPSGNEGTTINEIRPEHVVQKYQEKLDKIRFYDNQKKQSNEILNIAFDSLISNVPDLQVGESTKELSGSIRQFRLKDSKEDIPINIIDGSIKTEAKWIGVKSYKVTAIPNKIDVIVMLSAQDITDATNKLLVNIFITTIIAILIGLGISILLANQVTEPVRRLIRDIEIVANGNLNHTTLATSNDEIGVLAHTFNVMTQNLKSAHETEIENKAREHELKIATEIQSNLLPSQIPQIPNYDIATYYHPAKEVGGDYYDLIEIDQDHLGIVIADVSGKGIPGSMLMTMTRALIRMEATRSLSPAKIFTEVNRILAKDISRGMFVTAMYGILEISTHKFTISSAGHNPIIVARASTKQNELVNPKGMALGFDKGAIFERTSKDQTITLNRGDKVVFYTDGVPEAMSPNKEEFGDDRFLDIISKSTGQNSQALVNMLVQSLGQWKGNAPQSDDITIVTFMRT